MKKSMPKVAALSIATIAALSLAACGGGSGDDASSSAAAPATSSSAAVVTTPATTPAAESTDATSPAAETSATSSAAEAASAASGDQAACTSVLKDMTDAQGDMSDLGQQDTGDAMISLGDKVASYASGMENSEYADAVTVLGKYYTGIGQAIKDNDEAGAKKIVSDATASSSSAVAKASTALGMCSAGM